MNFKIKAYSDKCKEENDLSYQIELTTIPSVGDKIILNRISKQGNLANKFKGLEEFEVTGIEWNAYIDEDGSTTSDSEIVLVCKIERSDHSSQHHLDSIEIAERSKR